MIIVPTEKQFDWRHAPIVLFAIVTLNVLLFFTYQSGDDKKISESLESYQSHEYFDQEWPLFQKFLSLQREEKLLNDYNKAIASDDHQAVIAALLMRSDFYDYLQKNARSEFDPDFFNDWEIERAVINKRVQSISYLKNGLIAGQFRPLTFITHQFLHGGIMHLLGNMFFLVICGFAVEAAIGHWRFLFFYILSGIGAGATQVLTNLDSAAPLIGASGAISGVMAMYLAIFRLKKIEFFYWFFFVVGYVRAPALFILPFYIGKEVYSYLSDTASNVAFMAHAGGFVVGAILIGVAILINKSVLNTEYIEADLSVDPRQQKLAEIYEAIEKFRFEKALDSVVNLIKESGQTFELASLRYNLLKISRGESFDAAALALLSISQPMHAELKKMERVWLDSAELHPKLNAIAKLKLGMQFVSLETPAAAEQIFNQLLEANYNDPAMSVFAAKLANAFHELGNSKKKSHYQSLSQDFKKQFMKGS